MRVEDRGLIIKTSQIFGNFKEEIVENWLKLVSKENIIKNDTEFNILKKGFSDLLDDLCIYLSQGDFEAYYSANSAVAREISCNDISFKKFIRVFHLFEESYSPVLAAQISEKNILAYLRAMDLLHHETIAIVSEEYFKIKDTTLMALVKLSELRDHTTGFHLEKTSDYAALLAAKMGMDEDFIDQIRKAGPLHDIGKVGIKDDILLKPGALTNGEFNQMKTHTVIGAETIEKIIRSNAINRGYLLMARDIALFHHEKYDGSGYPDGLIGENIPLPARIFALVDAYDAIVSRRPYKDAFPHEVAVERIRKDSGICFDPNIVSVFLKIHLEFKAISERYNCESH